MITTKQRLWMMIFLPRAFFLGIGTSLVITIGTRDAWIGAILGIIFGLILVLGIKHIQKYKNNATIYDILKEMKFVGIIVKLFMILFSIFLIIQSLVILQTYTSSFFLLRTPFCLIELVVLGTVIYIVSKGLSTAFKMFELLIVISMLIFLFSFFNLVPYIEIDNFLPLFSSSSTSIFKTALLFASLSATPTILMIQLNDNGKHLMWGYLISTITILLILVTCLGVFGYKLANVFRYPEYLVLKKISLFNFIEKAENILSINWVIDLFAVLILATNFLKSSFANKHGKYVYGLILIMVFIISSSFLGTSYSFDTIIYYYSPYILLGFYFCIVIPLLIYFKTRKKH